MGFLVRFGLLQRRKLALGENEPVLGDLGLQRLEPLRHRLQVMALPDAAHPGRGHRQPALTKFVRNAHLAEGRLLEGDFDHRGLDLRGDPILQHRLAAANLGQRQFAALLVEFLKAIEAVARVAHDPTGLSDVLKLLGQFQQAHFGADDLLFLSHVGSPFRRGQQAGARPGPLPPFSSDRTDIVLSD